VRDIPLVDLTPQHAEVADDVRAGWDSVLASSSFVMGEAVGRFEDEFARFAGRRQCISVANGTDALELALRAVGVTRGGQVLVPANSFVASAVAVSRAGGSPRFVDVDPVFGLIDADAAEAVVTPQTQAVMPVHLYGQMADMTAIAAMARRSGLSIVEDAAQSHGATRHGDPAGSNGNPVATSFYPGKNLGAFGDAGAVVTDDDDIAATLRALRNYGSEDKYTHEIVGFNSRMDSLQAVVLSAKLERLHRWNDLRRQAARRYFELLEGLPGVVLPRAAEGNEHVWHLFVIELDERDRVLDDLRAAGIAAGIHYPVPIHLQPAYAALGYGPGSFPVAERRAERIMSLPLYPGITAVQQERVADAVRKAVLA
jgi:dTDP-4-amino-4,6-dideoxygalactose transaminase